MQTYNFYYNNAADFLEQVSKYSLDQEPHLLIQLFISIREEEQIKAITLDIQSQLPQAIIIGATTDGEILATQVSTDRVVVSVSVFQKSQLNLLYVDNEKSKMSSFEMGNALAQQINNPDTRVLISFCDGLNTNGEDLLRGIDSVSHELVISGGMAGDAAQFNSTYIIAGTKIIKHGVVGVVICSKDLKIHTNYSFNWQGIGRKMRVDKADKNRVYRIDGKSAVEVYKHYLGHEVADKLPAIGIEFPIIIHKDGLPVARAVLNRFDDDSLLFAGNVSQGDEVQLGLGNIDMILESASQISRYFSSLNIETFFIYSCMARRRFLQDDIQVELTDLSAQAPLSGFFTYGEFYKDDSVQLLNQTMTVLAMSESDEDAKVEVDSLVNESSVDDVQTTLKALSHLVNQTSAELESLNNQLEDKVKEKTAALEDKVTELELATRVKSDFLANMSHEIRTPLNAILGFMSLLARDERDTARIKQFSTVQDAGDTLLTIINDILDFSKIENGKLSIEKLHFKSMKPFDDVRQLFAQKAQESKVGFTFDFDDTISDNAFGDELRVKQVLTNLISNAIKFTPEGGRVAIACHQDNQNLVCAVSDTGRGISRNHKKHIFKAFEQADSSTTRKYGGTGLGLSISSHLVQLMGGEISVESELDKGSVFTFKLPLFSQEHSQKQLDKDDVDDEKIDVHEELLLKGKVLLVEDNKSNQMLMEIFLSEMGLDVSIAENGIEGFEYFKKENFDLILMDENMPEMNGIESTKKIRSYELEKAFEPIVIVAVTANALKGDKERFIEVGMDEYISKPVDPIVLKQVLAKFLRS